MDSNRVIFSTRSDMQPAKLIIETVISDKSVLRINLSLVEMANLSEEKENETKILFNLQTNSTSDNNQLNANCKQSECIGDAYGFITISMEKSPVVSICSEAQPPSV